MKKGICLLPGLFFMTVCVWLAGKYVYYWDNTPETLRIEAGSLQEFSLAVPANGDIVDTRNQQKVGEVFFDSPVILQAGMEEKKYEVQLKLYGILPFKKVSIEVIDEVTVWPVGRVYGFYLETQGVLVIGTGEFVSKEGNCVNPSQNMIHPGDYLLTVNGENIKTKAQFQNLVKESDGQELLIVGKRNGKIFSAQVKPAKYENGEYKLGLWIRDNAQGVGTVTYVDSRGCFGALGHPITDQDTKQTLNIESGRLYDAKILSIQKGEKNAVGEIHGMIDYHDKYLEGTLYDNSADGIYGMSLPLLEEEEWKDSIPVGMRQEVHTGEALIMSDISGTLETYSVRITNADKEDHSNQALSLTVTDERLLELTGGIVQGMSGCPIIQDGKLIGAVTHVLVSDSRKGYGIYMEDMMR